MTRNGSSTVDALWEAAAIRRSPAPSPQEQRAGIILLRELARGEPVTIAQLADRLGAPLDAAAALVKASSISPFILADGDRIRGFMGLSVTPTFHRMTIDGQALWTWCAYDTLFLPELLDAPAEVETRDPETEELNRLTVLPDRILTADPAGMVVSMVDPRAWDIRSATCVITSACQQMFFHASRATGEQWQANHPETVLLTLAEAFAFGKRANAHRFEAELVRRRTSAA